MQTESETVFGCVINEEIGEEKSEEEEDEEEDIYRGGGRERQW